MHTFSLLLPENSWFRMIKTKNKQTLFIIGTEYLPEYKKYGALES